MTDAQFIAWLGDSSAMRCVLVEVVVRVGGVETTRYLSNTGFMTSATDTPANTHYVPAITGGAKFSETLNLEGSTTISVGDLEIDNNDGSRDSWLTDIWTNRSIRIYVGDVSWPRADFRLILDGIVAKLDAKARNKINIVISDKMQRLNGPVSETKLGGTTANADQLIPLCFGECHNITPLLVDPVTNEYQVHNGPIEDIVEVRDNGIPVAVTKFLSTGKFRLVAQPYGQITCTVQGDKASGVYANDIGSIVKRIATAYGLADTRLTAGEINTASFTAFSTATNNPPVGLYLKERMNVIEAMNKLASSVGARVFFNRAGLLTIVQITLPRSDSGTTVTADDMVDRSLMPVALPPVQAAQRLGFCKNWTVQENIAAGVPARHADSYRKEWLTVTSTNATVLANHKLAGEPVMQETLLLTSSSATNEAIRRRDVWDVQRKVIRYVGMPWLLLEPVGATQTLQHSRFGLSAGVKGQIISTAIDWLNPRITVEVLI